MILVKYLYCLPTMQVDYFANQSSSTAPMNTAAKNMIANIITAITSFILYTSSKN